MRIRHGVVAVLVMFFCVALSAADHRFVAQTDWGTTTESSIVIGAYEFQPYSSGTALDATSNISFNRYFSATGLAPYAVANFRLPKGSVITGFSLQGCNNAVAGNLVFSLVRATPGQDGTYLDSGSLGPTGCGESRKDSNNFVYDDSIGPYAVVITPSQTGTNQSFTAMRVFYKLRVSPDTNTATFNDVPVGSSIHRFVEALVAAGITAGCGNGNYCPDTPVTRGQMAVFLSVALGLQWAP